MSDDDSRDSQKFTRKDRSGVALDKLALEPIMLQLQFAETNTLTGQYDLAISNLDFAWAGMHPRARKKLAVQPSILIKSQILREVPTEDKMLKDPRFFRSTPRQRERYRQQVAAQIVARMVIEIKVLIIDALQDSGLFVREPAKMHSHKDFPEISVL